MSHSSNDAFKAVPFAISCGVWLRGDLLEPSSVTALLGIEPTDAGRKGGVVRASAETELGRKMGFWRFTVKETNVRFEPAIAQALSAFDQVQVNLRSIAGVTDAFLDVFGAGGPTVQTNGGYFSLSVEQVARIAVLGLSVEVSISIIDVERGLNAADD
jgi:hypothetical protein